MSLSTGLTRRSLLRTAVCGGPAVLRGRYRLFAQSRAEYSARAIQLVGEDHVALGSDFDGGPTPPRNMRDVGDLPMITAAMVRRGYSEDRIDKFLGRDVLNLFRRVTEKKR